jgi:hypothetical protein
MLVELSVLSGARRGETVVQRPTRLVIGDHPDSVLGFDPAQDKAAASRHVILDPSEEGWQIASPDRGILLGPRPLQGSLPLRSGDIIRLSASGPDVRFALRHESEATLTPAKPFVKAPEQSFAKPFPASTSEPLAAAAPVMAPTPTPPQPSAPVAELLRPLEDESTAPAQSTGVPVALIGGIALGLIVMIGLGLAVVFWPGGGSATQTSRQAFPAKSIDEGTTLQYQPTFDSVSANSSGTYRLIAPPEGAAIDPKTGALSWTPSEEQGPGQFTLQFAFDPADGSWQRLGELDVTVVEVNQPPRGELVMADMAEPGKAVQIRIAVEDLDLPAQELSLELPGENAAGLQLDADKRLLTWTPSADHPGGSETIRVKVTDNGRPPQSRIETLTTTVHRVDPWERLAREQRPTLWLLTVQPEGSPERYPFATATAVDETTLVTTGGVAEELNKRRGQGWRIAAWHPDRPNDPISVDKLFAHTLYQATADSPADQIFFDLGMATVAEPLSSKQTLDRETLLLPRTQGSEAAVLYYVHNGDAMTRFAQPSLRAQVVTVAGEGQLEDGRFRLTALEGKLPPTPLGGAVMTQQGALLGIYATESGPMPDRPASAPPIHYAPALDAVYLWTQGQRDRLWTELSPPTETESPTPSPDA